MYRNIHYVTPLVSDTYFLLISITLRHSYQPEELSYTIIDMHYKVAG